MNEASNESRSAIRSTVMLGAVIEYEGQSIPVKISNVSGSGALVIGDLLPGAGSAVLFRRNELVVASRIAWVESGHAGLKFSEPLRVEDLLRYVPQLRVIAPQSFRRPGVK